MLMMPTVAMQSPFSQLRCKLNLCSAVHRLRPGCQSFAELLPVPLLAGPVAAGQLTGPAASGQPQGPAWPAALGPHAVEQDRPPRAAPGEGAPPLRSPGTLCRPAPRRPASATTSAGLPGPRPA